MAETVLASALEKQIWSSEYFAEYVRRSRLEPYMGNSPDSIIVTKRELLDEAGKTMNIPLLTRLKSRGVYNDGVLDGKEEALGNYNMPLSVQWVRNAVKVPKSQQYKTEINLINAARPMLRTWSAENLRDWAIVQFSAAVSGGINFPMIPIVDVDGNTVRAAATETEKDAWALANSDRILAGVAMSNYNADHSAMLANIDTTNDRMKVSIALLAKEMAQSADPHIRPYQIEDGREFYVMFHGLRSFRDLKADPVMTAANRDARPREVGNNPIFQDGDLIYDGVIHRCVPEITDLLTRSSAFATAGASSSPVEPTFLCGAQALAVGWGQMPRPITDRSADYEFRPGVAIEELRGVEKIHFNGKQHGIVTVYVSAPAST